MRNGNFELVRLFLCYILSVDAFSNNYPSTPYAEALSSNNKDIIDVLELSGIGCGHINYHVCAALAATAEIGDVLHVKRPLSHSSSDAEKERSLQKAAKSDHSSVALLLIHAGVATDRGRICGFGGSYNTTPIGFPRSGARCCHYIASRHSCILESVNCHWVCNTAARSYF